MASEKRNALIVALLIATMTAGAATLLWLEPATPGWPSATLLMAERAHAIEDVQIEYVGPDAMPDPAEYDCLISRAGNCEWQPCGPRIRLGVIGSGSQHLPPAQARTLLTVFGALTQRHGLELERVWLHPASDARLHPELPPDAHELCDLLVRKGIVP